MCVIFYLFNHNLSDELHAGHFGEKKKPIQCPVILSARVFPLRRMMFKNRRGGGGVVLPPPATLKSSCPKSSVVSSLLLTYLPCLPTAEQFLNWKNRMGRRLLVIPLVILVCLVQTLLVFGKPGHHQRRHFNNVNGKCENAASQSLYQYIRVFFKIHHHHQIRSYFILIRTESVKWTNWIFNSILFIFT